MINKKDSIIKLIDEKGNPKEYKVILTKISIITKK